ncbi:MAG: helix-turn-helix domain-containing protein [Micromonosporaceae bacterium]
MEIEPFGDRLRRYRQRAGMTRPVLGGLVGRSAEWVKALETGRLQTPRLPLLIRLAQLLGVDDLADLTGEQRIAAASYLKPAHEATPEIARALTAYQLAGSAEPVPAGELTRRLAQAWQLWHGSRTHRTNIAAFLPGLLHDTQASARLLDGEDRRDAQRLLAQTYHLAQLFLSFQPFPELIYLTGDRAMSAAQGADDPHAIAAAAWYVNHVYRDAGERHEARVELATQAAALLTPDRGPADLASWGLLQLAVALSYAKAGQDGAAWRHWDMASQAATALGGDYSHPWLIFGRGMVDAYAITMHSDLMRPGEAVRQADQTEIAAVPSATRRSFHLIETARAYSLRREPAATVYLLRRAYDESPDTIRFNLFSRSEVGELLHAGSSTVRDDVRDLAEKLDIAA